MNGIAYQWFVYFIIWAIIITVFVFFPDSAVSCGDKILNLQCNLTASSEKWLTAEKRLVSWTMQSALQWGWSTSWCKHSANVSPLTTRYRSMACTRARGSIFTGPPFHCLTLVQSGCLCSWHLSWCVLKNLSAWDPLRREWEIHIN